MNTLIHRSVCLILALSILSLAVVLSGCSDNKTTVDGGTQDALPVLKDCAVQHETEFGAVDIVIGIDAFNDLGFAFGDSVDVSFSNGYTLSDLPYYNGYYTKTGDPLVVGYPGRDHIRACINSGGDLWEIAGLSDNDTVTITLSERGKYADIQDARDLYYTDARSDYDSDEMFANFRAVKGGNIKENTVYRSASPCDNRRSRAPYADSLMQDAGVKYILNLADNEEKIAGYMAEDGFDSPGFTELYESGNVILLAMNMDFTSEKFRTGLLRGMNAMAENDGPFLIHCAEGKDRTGFVCMLIEALCGAAYDEIEADYMLTYANNYHFDRESDPEKYAIIVRDMLVPMIAAVIGDESVDYQSADLSDYAEQYLADLGLSAETIAKLKSKLTEE